MAVSSHSVIFVESIISLGSLSAQTSCHCPRGSPLHEVQYLQAVGFITAKSVGDNNSMRLFDVSNPQVNFVFLGFI